LTSPRFLKLYQHVLKPGGILHLKTDNRPLMDYSVETILGMGGNVLTLTHDLYQSEWKDDHHGIQTYFENKFTAKGFSINYLRFQLPELAVADTQIAPVFFHFPEIAPNGHI
ncbi:MAG TPA: hypothetical protein PKY12_14340, partial [Catalimonadaceae bacterium]|nr:hypothetical protein [Catalimonadaceae bacterium]